MKAARIHAWGNSDVVKIEEVDPPSINDNEVLIAVHAAGVNPVDWKVREGYYSEKWNDPFPFTLGWDVSGEIVSFGSKVTNFKIADEVYGLIRFPEQGCTFAQYVSAPFNQIASKPKRIDYVHAAAVPLAALTAWQTLFELGELGNSDSVLIHGAAGGVGQFAVQFAKWQNARVCATGTIQSKELLLSLGVDQFIDYQTQRFEEKIKNVDVVLDLVGGETALRSFAVIKPGGKLITTPTSEQKTVAQHAKEKNIQTPFMLVRPDGLQLRKIGTLIDDGLVKVSVQQAFPFQEVKDALNFVQSGHNRGKIVLKMR